MAQIDSSIYNAFAPKVKSVADYDNEAAQGQMNQLNLLRGQQQADEYTRKVGRENALRTFQQTLAGKSRPDQANALIDAGYSAEGFALQDQDLKSRNTEAGIKETNSKVAETNWKLVRQHAASIMQNPTPEAVEASLQHYGKVSGEDLTEIRNIFGQAKGDPEMIRRIAFGLAQDADKQMPKTDTMDFGGGVARQAIDPLTGKILSTQTIVKTQSPDNAATNETSRANNAASVAATIQAANIRSEGDRGKVPAGYRMLQDGTMEAVPGGPADLKKQGALNADKQVLDGSTSSFDRLAVAANEVLNHPGLGGITGWAGKIPNAPGSAATNAQAKLNTLKSQVGFGVLQEMRNNSKTGGALGSVSDSENKMLQANLASLENAQDEDQMRESLRKIVEYADGAKGRMRDAYNLKHGDQPPKRRASDNAPADDPLGLRGGR